MNTTTKSKVFIIEDHAEMRDSLRKLVDFEDDLQVCGVACNVEKGVEGILNTAPDVALIDLELGTHTGLDIIRALEKRFKKLPVLILSMHSEILYAESALYHGAQGYLMKSTHPDEIPYALRRVLSGDIYLSSGMRQRLHSKGEPSHD